MVVSIMGNSVLKEGDTDRLDHRTRMIRRILRSNFERVARKLHRTGEFSIGDSEPFPGKRCDSRLTLTERREARNAP